MGSQQIVFLSTDCISDSGDSGILTCIAFQSLLSVLGFFSCILQEYQKHYLSHYLSPLKVRERKSYQEHGAVENSSSAVCLFKRIVFFIDWHTFFFLILPKSVIQLR